MHLIRLTGLLVAAVALAACTATAPVKAPAPAPATPAAAGTTATAAAHRDQAPPLPLIPMPAHVQRLAGDFVLSSGAHYAVRGGHAARAVAQRFAGLLRRTRGLLLTPAATATATAAVRFELGGKDSADTGTEGYRLDIDADGIRISAAHAAGLYYGAITLWQLLTPEAAHGDRATLPQLRISDQPRFRWRGLMLDSARHFQSVAQIESLIDWMSLHKLNVLHWHLTDDQGWRLQIPGYPKLTRIGGCRRAVADDAALSGGPNQPYCGHYTDAQVRDIVRFAARRFITIVPEIDVPGHAQAAIAAYPWLGVTGRRPPVATDWGVDTYLFNPDARTMAFLEHVLDHVMQLFPSRYIHLGGDEAAKDQWNASPAVQAQIRRLGLANADALQHWMTNRLAAYLRAHGRRLIGWDEILGPGLAPGAAVMSWHGVSGGLAAARLGHDAVLAPSPTLYLDHLQSNAHDEPPGRPQVESLRDIYDFDPLPPSMGAAAARHILGVQANLWTEYMTTFARDQHAVFPRLAALAEVAWSPAATHDWKRFVARLPAQLARYRALGIAYARTGLAPQLHARRAGPGRARVTLATQIDAGSVHYTLDGRAPTPASPRYRGAFTVRLPATLRAAAFDRDGQPLGRLPATRIDRRSLLRRNSDQLTPCSQTIVLRIGDDRPLHGPRPVYRLNIADPCWLWKQAPLNRAQGLQVRVGNLPWRFLLWKDDSKVVKRAIGAAGPELVVRRDSCSGPVLARLSLAAASRTRLQTVLQARLAPQQGRHDLCLYATGDPHHGLWAIDTVQLVPTGAR